MVLSTGTCFDPHSPLLIDQPHWLSISFFQLLGGRRVRTIDVLHPRDPVVPNLRRHDWTLLTPIEQCRTHHLLRGWQWPRDRDGPKDPKLPPKGRTTYMKGNQGSPVLHLRAYVYTICLLYSESLDINIIKHNIFYIMSIYTRTLQKVLSWDPNRWWLLGTELGNTGNTSWRVVVDAHNKTNIYDVYI